MQCQEVWDALLGVISTATRRVELSSLEARSIHSLPYRASLKAQEAEKEEMHTLLAMEVI